MNSFLYYIRFSALQFLKKKIAGSLSPIIMWCIFHVPLIIEVFLISKRYWYFCMDFVFYMLLNDWTQNYRNISDWIYNYQNNFKIGTNADCIYLCYLKPVKLFQSRKRNNKTLISKHFYRWPKISHKTLQCTSRSWFCGDVDVRCWWEPSSKHCLDPWRLWQGDYCDLLYSVQKFTTLNSLSFLSFDIH